MRANRVVLLLAAALVLFAAVPSPAQNMLLVFPYYGSTYMTCPNGLWPDPWYGCVDTCWFWMPSYAYDNCWALFYPDFRNNWYWMRHRQRLEDWPGTWSSLGGRETRFRSPDDRVARQHRVPSWVDAEKRSPAWTGGFSGRMPGGDPSGRPAGRQGGWTGGQRGGGHIPSGVGRGGPMPSHGGGAGAGGGAAPHRPR